MMAGSKPHFAKKKHHQSPHKVEKEYGYEEKNVVKTQNSK